MNNIKVAYFSAEIGIKEEIKTYSGGLGILAGGTIKAMADLEVPFCAITLLYKYGFFKQKIVNDYQEELNDCWDYKNILIDTKKEIKVNISGTDIYVKIWKYEYTGITGHKIPIYFLDTHLEKNPLWACQLTDNLYQGDRLSQEIILGIGGIRALKELEINTIEKYHMNEGHSSFLTLELYKNNGKENNIWSDEEIKNKCVFTTHTPIPAGHDKFSYSEIYEKLKGEIDILPLHIKKLAGEDLLNTTLLALNFSSYHNGVSKKHGDVTKKMFPNFEIDYITNGVHLQSWTSKYFKELYNKYMPGWEKQNSKLKEIFKIPNSQIYRAHQLAKEELIDFINQKNIVDTTLKKNVLTIGFARRFIQYKDAELIFENLEELKKLGGKVQFIFAGKSHKNDPWGKNIMKDIIDNANDLKEHIQIAFLENYDIEIAKKLVAGCDLWLNTPIPPSEASGTSGMKAVVNGCLHFSRVDGWAIESFERNGGGFPIAEYEDFIRTLEFKIIPMYYSENKTSWVEEMKLSIGNSATYFNTHRMAKEYISKAYKIKY